MTIKLYQIDAFTNKVFGGNPAAVCPLNEWISEEMMQKIAEENNLAETAFYVKSGDKYEIRWFTPMSEVVLAGHPTLASAFVLMNFEGHISNEIHFTSKSGELIVKREGDFYTLNFPSDELKEQLVTEHLTHGFNIKPQKILRGKTDLMFVYQNEREVADLKPDFREVARIDARGVICTAPGKESDFVSRFFAPQLGIDEDPVTGSAHTSLIPYWAKELDKRELTAIQISPRRGYLKCKDIGDRVEFGGQAVAFMKGVIEV